MGQHQPRGGPQREDVKGRRKKVKEDEEEDESDGGSPVQMEKKMENVIAITWF
jgi:hypothetical protein